MKSSKYQRTIQEILDSDDELTTDYVESTYVPAYQDDNRFECVNELSTKGQEKLTEEPPISISILNETIKRGIFNKKDIFCLQCVQHSASNDTLLWFFTFLLHKDCQSNYKFLRSCLVPDYDSMFLRTSLLYFSPINKSRHRYNIIVKDLNTKTV